jgi:hypothetical protein
MVKLSVVVFWVVMQCGLVNGYQHFRGMHCLHLWLKMEVIHCSGTFMSICKTTWPTINMENFLNKIAYF